MGVDLARPTPTIEDYLGVIYTLNRDGERVIGRKLADWLEVSPPTVTATVQRMIRSGWVTMSDDKTIHLTPPGAQAARSLIRRHMLTELLLARVLGVSWSKVHEEAHRLEHDLSQETTDRLEEIVEGSDMCPHGNPLPGFEGLADEWIPLLALEPGRDFLVARIHEEIERNVDLMSFLEKSGLVPGLPVRLIEVMPFNETVSLRTEQGKVVLGLSVAQHIWAAETDSAAVGSESATS